MHMQKQLKIIAPAIMLACLALILFFWTQSPKPNPVLIPKAQQHTAVTAHSNASTLSEASLSSNILAAKPDAQNRLARLEQLGRVPENADVWDWSLAQKTSWWGKRIDPAQFWSGRPVWLDRANVLAAHQHGRFYPPIPYEDTRFKTRSNKDEPTMASPDSPDVTLYLTDEESAFWDLFSKTHPKPPESITEWQRRLAEDILGTRHNFEMHVNPGSVNQTDIREMEQAARDRVLRLGYPPEAFSDESLRWAYVISKRTLYEQQFVQAHTEGTSAASNFLARLCVDSKLITKPLTEDQLKASNAWKIRYLQRLRNEGNDESYIAAYLQDWNLSPDGVFAPTTR